MLPYETQLASGAPRARERIKPTSWSNGAVASLILVATREAWRIALTFDDGPDPEEMSRGAGDPGALRRRGTFFLVGKSAAGDPEIVARTCCCGPCGRRTFLGPSCLRLIPVELLVGRDRLGAPRLGAPRPTRVFWSSFGEQSLASRLDAPRPATGWRRRGRAGEDWRDDPADVLVGRAKRRWRRGRHRALDDIFSMWPTRSVTAHRADAGGAGDLLGRLARSHRFVTVPEPLRAGPAGALADLPPAPPGFPPQARKTRPAVASPSSKPLLRRADRALRHDQPPGAGSWLPPPTTTTPCGRSPSVQRHAARWTAPAAWPDRLRAPAMMAELEGTLAPTVRNTWRSPPMTAKARSTGRGSPAWTC